MYVLWCGLCKYVYVWCGMWCGTLCCVVVSHVVLCVVLHCLVPTFTNGSHHALPFLEERGLETVARVEAIGLVTRHQLLHGLQDHTQLADTQTF